MDISTKLLLEYVYELYCLHLSVYKIKIKHKSSHQQFNLNKLTNRTESKKKKEKEIQFSG